MVITIGLSGCSDCSHAASHKLLPCGHTTCSKHYVEVTDDYIAICEICSVKVRAVAEIKSARATDPAHQKNDYWSVEKTHQLFNSLSMNQGRDSKVNPPLRNIDAASPTPAPPKRANDPTHSTQQAPGGYGIGGNQQPTRYVPPPLRNTQTPNVRPESSISNATFASQPPTPMPQVPPPAVTNGRGPSNRAYYENASMGYGLPPGGYRFGPGQLNQQFASLDPFVDARRPMPQGTYQNSSALVRNDNNMYGIANRATPRHPLANAMTMSSTSSNHSARASGAANGSVVDMSRAAHLAAIIRSGATEDPNDIDYGNPGRSKRLPPERVTLPSAPMPHGKVAVGYGNALVSYHDVESHTKGNPAVFLGLNDTPRPQWLLQTQHGYMPSLEEVLETLPMVEGCRVAKPSTAGFVLISDVPYSCSRPEIVAFLGKNAQILTQPEGSPYHAVHIMMDRATAKTNDVFVEVKTPREAVFIVSQFQKRRSVKLGDRDVTVRVSSQAEFMAELFPRAKNVEWYGAVPQVSDHRDYYYTGVPSSGFQGFVQDEELTFMAKYAEHPSNSPFAARVPCRNFEHLVTLLHKYPWHAVQHVFIEERDSLFMLTEKMIDSLVGALRDPKKNPKLDRNLPTTATLQEIIVAAMTCPGFSEFQKAKLADTLGKAGYQNMTTARGMNFRFGGTHKFAAGWPFHALIKQPSVHDEVVEYVAGLLRAATMGGQNPSLTQIYSLHTAGTNVPKFGMVKVNYTGAASLADVAAVEMRTIKALLSRVLSHHGTLAHGSYSASPRS